MKNLNKKDYVFLISALTAIVCLNIIVNLAITQEFSEYYSSYGYITIWGLLALALLGIFKK